MFGVYRRNLMTLLLSVVLTGIYSVTASGEYKPVVVEEGGTITGRVTCEGGQANSISSDATKDAKTCGAHVVTPIVEIGSDGGLRNVVVFIEDIGEGAAIDRTVKAQLDNIACKYEPHVQSMCVGQVLEITNSDPVFHNTHAFLNEKTLFNLAMPLQNQKVRKRIKKSGLATIACDAGHTWMSASIYIFEHPYHATTDASGQFYIDNVPDGTYRVTAWHETLGTQTSTVAVEAGGESKITYDSLSK